MARGKRYQPEQVVNLLRQIEVAVANGKTNQAKRLKELEQENSKLKRLVANLSLDNLVLKDIASGNF
jgi:cell division protein FtsB